eukprot:3415349-Pyramimonas_sp.AAC.1
MAGCLTSSRCFDIEMVGRLMSTNHFDLRMVGCLASSMCFDIEMVGRLVSTNHFDLIMLGFESERYGG